MADPNISHIVPMSSSAVRMIQKEVAKQNAMQVQSQEDVNQYLDVAVFNPMQRARQFKELHELKSSLLNKKGDAQDVEEPRVAQIEEIEETASRFQKNNYELGSKVLLLLREQIGPDDSPEDVLKKVTTIYGDPALADEALDFLIDTADPQMRDVLLRAKEQLNASLGREVRAGRNMGVRAREFSEAGLGSPTSLRDMYRDITGTPRDPLVLFNELTEKFQYEKLKPAIHFLLHSLGNDLKAKGPSIPRGELKRLIDEIRSLQGILGVFRFFQSRMHLIQREFSSYHLVLPPRLDFETLAKLFIKLLAERFMNPEKILQTARLLGVADETAAQIILYTQMRDALKQISPRYFRNPMHRDELWKSYIDVLEQLEDTLEEEEEEQEKENEEDT